MVGTYAFHEMIKCPKYLITSFCGHLFLSFSGTENEMRCPSSFSMFRRSASTYLDDRFETPVAVLASCENFSTATHQYTQYRTHSCKKLAYANFIAPPPTTHIHTHTHTHTEYSPVVKVTCHKRDGSTSFLVPFRLLLVTMLRAVCLLSQTSVCSVFRVWDCT